MGEIVAALGTCHTPYLFTRPPDENAQQLDQAAAAIQELGKALDESKPDVILMFGADHVETFSVTCVPSFAIVAGSRAIAKFAGREHNLPIHREMAEDILNKLVVEHNFDMAYSEDAELGHAFSIPFEFLIGKRNIPVIPFFTNVYVPPLPTPRRCEALGKAIAQIVKGRKERVAIVASGGMSHFPGTTKYTNPEFDFDRWLVSQMEAGNTDALLNMTGTQLDEVGNTEMLNWAVMFGAIGAQARRADRLHPDLAPRSGDDALPARSARGRTRRRRSAKQYGGFQFKNEGYSSTSIRRRRPTRSTSCCSSRATASRSAIASSTTSRTWRTSTGWRATHRQAARAMIDVAKGPLVSDHVKPLADAGCHPLQALMSLHVIYSTTHKARAAANGERRQTLITSHGATESRRFFA